MRHIIIEFFLENQTIAGNRDLIIAQQLRCTLRNPYQHSRIHIHACMRPVETSPANPLYFFLTFRVVRFFDFCTIVVFL